MTFWSHLPLHAQCRKLWIIRAVLNIEEMAESQLLYLKSSGPWLKLIFSQLNITVCYIFPLHVLWCSTSSACPVINLVINGWLYVAYWQIIVHYRGIREIVLSAYLDGSSMLQKTSACHSITVGVKEIITGLRLRRHVKLIALLKWVSFSSATALYIL